MAVEVLGVQGEIDGYGDSMHEFRSANELNAKILLNLADGKTGKARHDPRPVHDHSHPDNLWPKMMYHPANGEKLVGVSLKGVTGQSQRAQQLRDNQQAVAAAEKEGYRMEPYAKPQVVVLDPAQEKAAILERNKQLEGALTVANDLIRKLDERLAKLEKAS